MQLNSLSGRFLDTYINHASVGFLGKYHTPAIDENWMDRPEQAKITLASRITSIALVVLESIFLPIIVPALIIWDFVFPAAAQQDNPSGIGLGVGDRHLADLDLYDPRNPME